ncbi:UNVERIFIED_CONTAM: hypothetical protein PYX00_004064 [Menopon gallinae]|uniref:Dihydroorotate dehydrogenase (quinone), mitochondrial n=1 Tax=Menopon gallinae TaxID=328185 RepID=A0AAW2I2U2_9NEOP
MRISPKFWAKIKDLSIVTSGGVLLFSFYNIYNGNEKFYDNVLMPLFFKINPETAHKIAVAVAKYNLVPKSQYIDPDCLKSELWGLRFKNPLGVAAGFDKHGEAIESLHNIGFGFVEIGSVTPLPQPGNQKPRVFRLLTDNAIINRYGFNSDGHDAVYNRLKTLKEKKFEGIIGVNLGKNKNSADPVKDYVSGIEKFGEVADYFVINVSSPNTPGLREWQKKEQLKELLSALIKAKNNLPVTKKPPILLKLAPDITDKERRDIAELIILDKECKIDGLVISNTTIYRPELTSPDGDEEGGLSGRPLQSLSTKLISDMYAYTYGKVPIIGVGGIFDGQDAYEKIKAGACLIQIYTGFAYHGPPRVLRIKKELDDLLRNDGYQRVSEAVGKSSQQYGNINS